MKYIKLLPVALILIFLLSCDEDPSVASEEECPGGDCIELYMPLEVGNYWVYEDRLFEPTAIQREKGLPFDGIQDTFEILEELTFDGKSAFRASPFISDGVDGDSYWAIENNRLYLWIDYGKANDSVNNTSEIFMGQGWTQILHLATDTVVTFRKDSVVDMQNGTRSFFASVENHTFLSPYELVYDGLSSTTYVASIQTEHGFRDTINGSPASLDISGRGRIYIFMKNVGLVQHTFRFEQQDGMMYEKVRTLMDKGQR